MKQELNQKSGLRNVNSNIKGVWSVVENEHLEKPIWMRMGTAFVNRDNSINVLLDATPKSFKLHIRDLEPKQH